MLISPAFAQAAGAPQGDILSFLLPIVLMFGVFWLLVFRPQQKKLKHHKEMVANLKRGDQVLTGGGLYGRVAKIEGGNICYVEIAPNVKVKVAQSTIAEVITKPEPQAGAEADEKGKDGESKGVVEKPS
ncbi:MAG: preprotein translocase subunit YajC [Alphaproteobacteria bacterium]